MAIRNDASLRGKIRAIAKREGLRPQEVLQMFLFEHLLLRLEKTSYVDKFILKGGLLISSMIGVSLRTTMDMDTTVVGMPLDRDSIEQTMEQICSVDVGDGMEYIFERVESIRTDDEYPNWRAHIMVRYGRMNAPIKVDVTTGDSIVPAEVEYPYPMLFEDRAIRLMSYPVATILAEKFETVVSRGVANTRGRDFYDIYVFLNTRGDQIEYGQVKRALEATARKRGTSAFVADYRSRLEKVRLSDDMLAVWESYVRSAPYASDISFDDVVSAAVRLGNLVSA